ncbi:MAG: endonuclease/exonuclease/phosphatase family protein [Planctomycetes bacterium]|nr:endonuclease/exonuclease/phosphatase family protein [Planctomycetota bacterium]
MMSFNIRYGTAEDGENSWQNRKEILFGFLKLHSSDIIGMQEVLNFQLEEIKIELAGYKHLGIGRDGETKGEYSPILYKHDKYRVSDSGTFWLSATPDIVGSITWGNACTRICSWAKFEDKRTMQEFYFYNLHLDHVSQPSREKSIDLLLSKIKKDKPLIIVGDFNAGEKNPAILKLKSAGLADTYRQIHKQETKVKTFHNFTGKTQGNKIDYVFVSENIQTIDARILHYKTDGRYPSDHFPVTAKIILSYKKD